MGDAARLANNFLLPPTHWAAQSDFAGYSYHPEKSRSLLAQAGYSEKNPLRLTYKTSNSPVRVRIASVIQQQLADVGIELDLRSYDWGTFYGDIKSGRFQIFSLSWIGIKMPDIYRYAFHSQSIPPSGANRGRLQNVAIDTLITQAEEAATVAEQAVFYRQLQSLLLQELPYVPLWYEDNVLVMQKRVTGYTLALDGNYDGLIQVEVR
jgi:peptide/nickel transport system substrate-binding protein